LFTIKDLASSLIYRFCSSFCCR